MDNQETNRNDLLDDILNAGTEPEQIGADESAVHAAGLTHPNDVELERILAEDWSATDDVLEPTMVINPSSDENTTVDAAPQAADPFADFFTFPDDFSTEETVIIPNEEPTAEASFTLPADFDTGATVTVPDEQPAESSVVITDDTFLDPTVNLSCAPLIGATQIIETDEILADALALIAEPANEEAAAPTIIAENVIPEPAFPADPNDETILFDPAEAAVFFNPSTEESTPVVPSANETVLPEPEPVAEPAVVEPTPEAPVAPQPPRKKCKRTPTVDPYANIRPRKPRTYAFLGIPHMISTLIWIVLIAFFGISMGRTLWVCTAEIMAFGKEDHHVTISLSEDEAKDIDAVAEKLHQAGLIEYPKLFKFFSNLTDKSANIAKGTYTLNASLDYNAMITSMSATTTRQVVEVMFPEGYTCAQIFQLLEELDVCTVAEMEAFLENYDPETGTLDDYWFLEGVNWGDKYCLEGYLAPDTYQFYTGDSPEHILSKFLVEFDDRFTDIMKEDFEDIQYRYMQMLYAEGYSSQYIQEHKLTLHEVLTVASIVQKETGSSSESFDIASVFYNRVTSGMELGSDATVYYAIGDYLLEHGELTSKDLDTDSPYNTRKYKGLPPGPICNPGTYALYAALDPNDTEFLYFVYDSDAKEHLFSETLEEHERKCKELGLW